MSQVSPGYEATKKRVVYVTTLYVLTLGCAVAGATASPAFDPNASTQAELPGIALNCACALFLGAALGLYGGSLFHAILAYWEDAKTSVGAARSVIGILLPVGGGSLSWYLGGKEAVSMYVLGLALGLLVAYARPRRVPRFTFDDVKHIVKMSDTLREVADVEDRVSLILTPFMPTKCIEKQECIRDEELARRLERATDALEATETKGDGAGAGSGGHE